MPYMHRFLTKCIVHHFWFLFTYFLMELSFLLLQTIVYFYFYDSFSTDFMKPSSKEAYAADSCNQCTTKCPWFTASFTLGLTDKSPALSRKWQLVKGRFIIPGPGILVSEEKTGRGVGNLSSVSDTSHSMNISEIGFLFAEGFCKLFNLWTIVHRVARKEQWRELK